MSRFIGLYYTTHDGKKGCVLVSVDKISTVTFVNQRVFVNAEGENPYVVDHTFKEVMEIIEKAGGAIFDSKQSTSKQKKNPDIKNIALDVRRLFSDLKWQYETMYNIGRALKKKYPDFYTTDHINGIAQRLTRLENSHNNLDSYPQKIEVLKHLMTLSTNCHSGQVRYLRLARLIRTVETT